MATEAQILANKANAAKSKGPTSPEGKMQSRTNSLKHGLTGAGIVLPERDTAEVHRRADAFAQELFADGELEHALVRRLALHSLRMERAADQQTSALSEHIRQVEAEFVAPAGLDEAQVARLRAEASRRAMFDTSKEATLARKYEAASERSFYRALKELRELRKPPKGLDPAADAKAFQQELGSILAQGTSQAGGYHAELGSILAKGTSDADFAAMLDQLSAKYPDPTVSTPNRGGLRRPLRTDLPRTEAHSIVPFAIGKAR